MKTENRKEDKIEKNYPIYFCSEKHKQLLVIQSEPEQKWIFKDKEISPEDLINVLDSMPEFWISVNDRLPDNNSISSNDLVLFWSKTHGMPMVGCFDYETEHWSRLPWEKGYESLSFDDVTHWMPILKNHNQSKK